MDEDPHQAYARRMARELALEDKDRSLLDVHTYLASLGVDDKKANQARSAAWSALCKYRARGESPHASGDESAKIHAEEIAKAAAKLATAIEGGKRSEAASDDLWSKLADAHATYPDGVTTDSDAQKAMRLSASWRARIGFRSSFLADVRLVRDAATGALERLKIAHRPASARSALVDDLAVIWRRATGKDPTASGAGDFISPRSRFGVFVRHVVEDDPDFEKGFADLVKNAVTRFRERNPARGAKGSETI